MLANTPYYELRYGGGRSIPLLSPTVKRPLAHAATQTMLRILK